MTHSQAFLRRSTTRPYGRLANGADVARCRMTSTVPAQVFGAAFWFPEQLSRSIRMQWMAAFGTKLKLVKLPQLPGERTFRMGHSTTESDPGCAKTQTSPSPTNDLYILCPCTEKFPVCLGLQVIKLRQRVTRQRFHTTKTPSRPAGACPKWADLGLRVPVFSLPRRPPSASAPAQCSPGEPAPTTITL
jgi:hypothetical protein